MAVRLALASEPAWFDLPEGIRVQVRPMSAARWARVRTRMRRYRRDWAEEVGAADDDADPLGTALAAFDTKDRGADSIEDEDPTLLGTDPPASDTPAPDLPNALQPVDEFTWLALAIALGVVAIADWQGVHVGDAIAPITVAAVSQVMVIGGVAEAFVIGVQRHSGWREAEGKKSETGSTGMSAVAPPIAATAPPSTPLAAATA